MAILSIQSHVVYGYAGNTAAVFPMQRLGREVWAINTVEFSNHTGYGAWRGQVLGGALVEDLVSGLDERGVLPRCEAILSGYMGDAEVGKAITGAIERVRAVSPQALYCCDPVMGDVGRGFYVKPDIPGIFKNTLIPLADIITPNQFELEALTGIDAYDRDGAYRAIEDLHKRGPKIILVTSYGSTGSELGMLVSDRENLYSVRTPELPIGRMAGSGDITAAVFLCRYLETRDIQETLRLCTASVYSILEKSLSHYQAMEEKPPLVELQIIQAQEELERPGQFFEVERIH
ncbi:MAG: pyridoxal kinase PdxY [Treponema sp.]|nr:pyridoxal kinase PdxY [Treponema sp.]